MSLKSDILSRFGIVYIGALVVGALIVGRVLYIQLFEGTKWTEISEERTLKDKIIKPSRGNIYDDEGRLLASSVPYYELRMDMKCPGLSAEKFSKNVDSLALQLSKLFRDKSKSQYKKELKFAYDKGKRYHLIKRKANYLELKQCKKFPILRDGRFKGGFIYLQEYKRMKPHKQLASRTIGYLTQGPKGNVVGLEGAFDKDLTGEQGVRLMQKISGGIWMPVSDDNQIEPKDGNDIYSTINVNLQDVAHHALYKQLQKSKADYGCAVLMEVKTGAIKAIANLKSNGKGAYSEEFNYAVGRSSEPGSTFKLVSIMAALEDGFVDLDDTVDCGNGSVMYFDKKITESNGKGLGKRTVKEVFELSSNVGVSKIVTEHYGNAQKAFINRVYSFGVNEKLNTSIKGEAYPYIKYPGEELWSGITLPQMSMGYEVRLSPLQILTFYNAIANEGRMVKPMFVKEITYHGKKHLEYKPVVLNPSICSESTIEKARLMLEGVVQNGTATKLKNTPFKIAGKTGTAKLYDEKKGTYVKEYEASFVGYFPADNPEYSCIVVVHRPRVGGYYGAEVAGPVFKEIAYKVYSSKLSNFHELATSEEQFIPYTKAGSKKELVQALESLEIPYDDQSQSDWIRTISKEDKIHVKNLSMHSSLVPNVKQMGLKDAIYLLETSGLRVKVQGKGTVKAQSLMPGARFKKGDLIELTMSFS